MLNSQQIEETEEKVYTITEDLNDQQQQEQLKELAQFMRQEYSEKNMQYFITQLSSEKKEKEVHVIPVEKERLGFFKIQKLHPRVKYGAAACLFVYSSYVLAKFLGRRRQIKLRS